MGPFPCRVEFKVEQHNLKDNAMFKAKISSLAAILAVNAARIDFASALVGPRASATNTPRGKTRKQDAQALQAAAAKRARRAARNLRNATGDLRLKNAA